MQQRLVPTGLNGAGQSISLLGIGSNYNFYFPQSISQPNNTDYILTSTFFRLNGKTCFLRNKLNSRNIQVIEQGSGNAIVDNIGEYFLDGRVRIIGFAPESILGGNNFIKISVTPGNQSAISPTRNNILLFDDDVSFETPIEVSST
jgi:hypothetical protein